MPLLNIDWDTNGRQPMSFLNRWCCSVSDALNAQFPKGAKDYVAQMAVRTREKTGHQIARFALGPPTVWIDGCETDQKYPSFDAPLPTFVAPARFTDEVAVNVIDASDSHRVAAAVLFVTPDNKADSDSALAFAVRAAQLMSSGAGVVVVDALPGPASWATHLHSLTGVYPITKRPRGTDSPVLAVHPMVHNGAELFGVWHHNVPAGAALPTVPVAVRGAMHLKLDLEATYADAVQQSKLA